MAKRPISTDTVQALLESQRVATLEDLKDALDTTSTMTVFRPLKALGYLSSYSHRGKYYTLPEIADFDEQGLWGWHSVWFSRAGNLVETARTFVEKADSGFTASQLGSLLHVECKRALLQLYRQHRVARDRIGGVYVYVYLAKDRDQQRRQKLCRQEHTDALVVPSVEVISHDLQAAILLLFSLLDEKQRRLYAGLESQKFGHGGDRKIAALLDLDVHTVARGRRELFSDQVESERVRGTGGGRKAVEKKRPRSSKRSKN
jgi:hypothetical protein